MLTRVPGNDRVELNFIAHQSKSDNTTHKCSRYQNKL